MLRRAFDAMMNDADFRAEADKVKMDFGPSTGEEAQTVAEAMLKAPPIVIERARALILGPVK